ncbi:monofunctional biosynthetic peptidoglycan transglycosylase [Bartonella tamiae]|nr:monofunctional biosynthetic peptidoglycan transglycosylase [Bartonella tamiae]
MTYFLLIVLVLPFFFIVFYRLPFIHPLSTLMIKDLVLLRGYDRQWVRLNDISPHLRYAVIMSEDGKFCAHHGVDWKELQSVITSKNGPSRGASTITMQMVKNLFLWHGRPYYVRKALEISYAVVADQVLSKEKILEIYLNIAEWGSGIYGAEAAAQHYFKRSAKNLTARQAALMAVALPNPKLRHPAKPSVNLTRLAILIENRARQSGAYIQCVR